MTKSTRTLVSPEKPQQTSTFRAKKRHNDRQFVPMREGAVWGATPRAKRAITLKQRRYCAGRMRGLSRIQAARAAGYGLSAAQHPKRIERSPAVAFVLQKWMDRQGISDRALDHLRLLTNVKVAQEIARLKDRGESRSRKVLEPVKT